jgi:deoxyadenosine/deoxycytidine kinase
MNERVVYVSGTHGSGKSTLIAKLANTEPGRFLKFDRIPIPKGEGVLERELIRASRHYLQTFHEEQQAHAHPGSIVLGDRCIIDNWGYMNAFLRLGWVTLAEHAQFRQLYDVLFPRERRPQSIVFLDPPPDVAISNIRKRWAETGEKKWREDNFGYLAAAQDSFREFYRTYDGNVLRLATPDLAERVERCREWTRGMGK